MKNHIHMIVKSDNLSKEIANFKSYTARQIIDHLIKNKSNKILNKLMYYKLKHKKDRRYQLWQEGIHPIQIDNEKILKQKIEYMHNNPVKEGLVEHPEDWINSSALNYSGKKGILDVETDWY